MVNSASPTCPMGSTPSPPGMKGKRSSPRRSPSPVATSPLTLHCNNAREQDGYGRPAPIFFGVTGLMKKRFMDKMVDRDWLNTNFPCMMACPAHTNAGRYVSLIGEGRFEEAYRFARDPNPLASICGRVCAHPCETACRRGEIDRPIQIRALKRFLTERYGPESRHPLEMRRTPAAKLPYRVA